MSESRNVPLIDCKPEEICVVLPELGNRVPGCKLIVRVHGILMEVTKHAVRRVIGKVLRKTVELELLLNCLRESWFEKELSGSRRGSQSI